MSIYDPIKVIEAWRLSYNLGSCLELISRQRTHSSGLRLEDLLKARSHLDREIKCLENELAEALARELASIESFKETFHLGAPERKKRDIATWDGEKFDWNWKLVSSTRTSLGRPSIKRERPKRKAKKLLALRRHGLPSSAPSQVG